MPLFPWWDVRNKIKASPVKGPRPLEQAHSIDEKESNDYISHLAS